MILKILTFLARAGLVVMVFMFVFYTGDFYGKYGGNYPVSEFFTMEHRYEIGKYGGIPLEAQYRIDAYNDLVLLIWFALAFLFLYFVFDYFHDRKNHFFTKIMAGLKVK